MCLDTLYSYMTGPFLSIYKRASFNNYPTHFIPTSPFFLNCTITVSPRNGARHTELYLTTFIGEYSSIAVFATTQDAQIPASQTTTSRGLGSLRARLSVLTWLVRRYSAKMTVVTEEGESEYSIPSRAVKWWSAEHGVLLLNGKALYNSWFEQKAREEKEIIEGQEIEGKEEMEQNPFEGGWADPRWVYRMNS